MDNKESKVITNYKIKNGDSWTSGVNGSFNFSTAEEAIKEAKMFKENPRCHNEDMSDENVKYWQSQTYEVQKEILIIETIVTI